MFLSSLTTGPFNTDTINDAMCYKHLAKNINRKTQYLSRCPREWNVSASCLFFPDVVSICISDWKPHDSQWSIMAPNKTRAALRNTVISVVFVKIAWLYVKIVPLFPPSPPPPAVLQNKRINTSIFPNFAPISRCSLSFHFTLRFSLFIDETEEGGGRPLQTGTNLTACERVRKCVIYSAWSSAENEKSNSSVSSV